MVSSKKETSPKVHRYKGIEGFLRRIAFNLGNTPSETEVKIISCIPIDVTDLQEKIVSLERQLEETKCHPKRTRSQTAYPLTLNSPRLRVLYPQGSNESLNVQTNPDLRPGGNCAHDHQTRAGTQDAQQSLAKSRGKDDSVHTESRRLKPAIPEKARRTHLVYYAEAEMGSPFRIHEHNTNNNAELEKTIDQQYLSSLIKRQYEIEEMCEAQSQLSAPVCRDVQPIVQSHVSEDLCSCCRGHFFDLDHTTCREITRQPSPVRRDYYDCNYYDVKPVKEQLYKNNKVLKEPRSNIGLTFCPEYYPFKPEYSSNSKGVVLRAHIGPKSIKRLPKRKYHTRQVILQNDSSHTDGLVEFSHIYSKRLSLNQTCKPKPVSKNAKCMTEIECTIDYLNSKLIQTSSLPQLVSCCTNMNKPASVTNVHVDQTTNGAQCPKEPTKPVQTVSMTQLTSTNTGLNKATFKNAECFTLPINETECQTDPIKYSQPELVNPPEPNKTEATLEQIKRILQTVLTEVKTNSQMQAIEQGKPTKDEITQNKSVLSPDCERLLGSITYSPSTNNPYHQMACCSRCLPPFCGAMPPQAVQVPTDMSYVHNFPVFVHRTLATQACCPERSALMHPKQTSTNTLQRKRKKRTPETETLIKEIYKSIALNVDYPTPTKNCAAPDESKPTNICKDAPNEFRTANTMTQGREEIICRGDITAASRETKLKEHHSSHSVSNIRPRRRDSFYASPRHVTSAMRREIQAKNFNKPDDGANINEELATFAFDVENDEDIAQPSTSPAKPPKGFFGKVLSSVFKIMRKKEEQPSQKEQLETRGSWSVHNLVPPTPRRPKRVSYAPEQQPRGARSVSPTVTSSKCRRLNYLNRGCRWNQDSPRTPRHAPRSALRAQPLDSASRRAALLPHSHPRSSSFDVRRHHQNQLHWRPVNTSFYPNESLRPKPRSTGIKLTNKTWMQKPVYHLGFACGPEKRKILANH